MQPIPPIEPRYVRTNHAFHLLMSLVSCGLWLFVWPVVAIMNSYQNAASRRTYERALHSYQAAVWTMREYERKLPEPEYQPRPTAGHRFRWSGTLPPSIPPRVDRPSPAPPASPAGGQRYVPGMEGVVPPSMPADQPRPTAGGAS